MEENDIRCKDCGCPNPNSAEYIQYQLDKANRVGSHKINNFKEKSIEASQFDVYIGEEVETKKEKLMKENKQKNSQIDDLILRRKARLLSEYNIHQSLNDITEEQYNDLLKYLNLEYKDSTNYTQDTLTSIFNIVAILIFLLSTIGAVLVGSVYFSVYILVGGFLSGLLFISIGRIIDLLKRLLEK